MAGVSVLSERDPETARVSALGRKDNEVKSANRALMRLQKPDSYLAHHSQHLLFSADIGHLHVAIMTSDRVVKTSQKTSSQRLR